MTKWLAKQFGRALVRRLAYLLVAFLLMGLGIGNARAQYADCGSTSINNADCPSKEAAYAAAKAYVHASLGGGPNPTSCHLAPDTVGSPWSAVSFARSTWNGTAQICPPIGAPQRLGTRRWPTGVECDDPEGIWNDETKACDAPPDCDISDPALSGGYISTPTPDAFATCVDGCSYIDTNETTNCDKIDGVFWCSVAGWEATGQVCTPGPSDGVEPPTDTDNDGISDGNDTNPDNPGESNDNEGDGDGDDECGAPGQDPCNNDDGTSGSGNTSTGGGDCGTPPNSNGDAILAQIAYQTWATRCAAEGLGSNGSGVPGEGEGTDLEPLMDYLQGEDSEGDIEVPWLTSEDQEVEWESGVPFSAACPAPESVSFTIVGKTASFDFEYGGLCSFATYMHDVFIALAWLSSAFILLGTARKA